MDSWDPQTPSPNLKFEGSPTESFLSTESGDAYPSLFPSSPSASTMNPREMLTPESSYADDNQLDVSGLASLSGCHDDTAASTPEPGSGDKKQTKKRKSWGQVLPEPKTNLPPR